MFRQDDELEEIEALIWRTGTRDRMAVKRIMARISAYGGGIAIDTAEAGRRRTAQAMMASTRRRRGLSGMRGSR